MNHLVLQVKKLKKKTLCFKRSYKKDKKYIASRFVWTESNFKATAKAFNEQDVAMEILE